MWKVEYRDAKGEVCIWGTEFHTRKAARLWCKKAQRKSMVLIDPDGNREKFFEGV